MACIAIQITSALNSVKNDLFDAVFRLLKVEVNQINFNFRFQIK